MSAPIVWGREIPVDGVRPAWLADDVEVRWRWADEADYTYDTLAEGLNWSGTRNQPKPVSVIKLPADHFVYKALDAGFEPWGGGDAAPSDWDGGDVLLRCGGMWKPGSNSGIPAQVDPVWQRGYMGDESRLADQDCIGYLKRITPAEQAANTVTIERMTEGDAGAAYWKATGGIGERDGWLAALRHFGLIREETDLERFSRETRVEITDENRAAIERALSWSAAR